MAGLKSQERVEITHPRDRAGSLPSNGWPPPAPESARGLDGNRGLHLFVQAEEVLQPLALGLEATAAVEAIDCAVDGLVGTAQVRRHEVGVVELGQGGAGMGGPGREDGVGERSESFEGFRFRRRRRERVVHEADRVAIVALEAAADLAQPGHVHCGSQNREEGLDGTLDDADQIARDHRRFEPADGNVLATLRTDLGYDEERLRGEDIHVVELGRQGEVPRRLALAG